MTVEEVARVIESWAPTWIAWERDNVGIQVGDPRSKVSKILVALDVTESVVSEAVSKKANLIVSHHPLLFRPPRNVTTSDQVGKLVLSLAEKKISLYSAHTNLDFTKGGVSFELANSLGLSKIRFLLPLKGLLCKITVFVPSDHVDRVAEAMSGAGAGVIGEYESCSFRVAGTGTFRGSRESKPFVGKPGRLETAEEIRLEMVAPRSLLASVVNAMKAVHPYEEVAYDVYPLDNQSPNFGSGAVGELPKTQPLKKFLETAKRALRTESLRVGGALDRQVKKVAVCGGSGSDLLAAAIKANADVFLTADVRYHTFHAAEGNITLVDAGHWETEQVILRPIATRLKAAAQQRGASIDVFVTKVSTNPVHMI